MKTKLDCGCEIEVRNETVKDCDGQPSLHIDFDNIKLDCPRTWALFCDGDTKGIFQLEKNLGQQWSKKIQPTSIEDAAALISLIRPGCLEAVDKHGKNMAQNYVDRKNGIEPKYDEEEQSICDKLEHILGNTYNIIVYQEQAMRIAVEIGGFDGQEADVLRKAIGKKKPELMKIVRDNFLMKCKTTGIVSDSEALAIFDIIEKSQRYSFNKCVTGDTLFKKNKGKYNTDITIEEMFLIRNCKVYAYKTNHHDLHKKWKRLGNYGKAYSLCEDNRIRPNIIKDIRFIGVHPVYNIITSSGKSIKVTINHKFPTDYGEKTVKDLKIGDNLIICDEYDSLSDKKYNWSGLKQDTNKTYKNNKSGFPKGESNPGYTNGEYSKWQKNKKKLPNKCDICNKIDIRLECHHKDGDRTNNKLSNLQILCVSCHKKIEYKNGRRRKGEKGYPSYLEKIVKIEKLGKERVYDVEMKGPNHNFVINNDIVTCNSHAIAYALMGYHAAYTKAHYPLHYICSWLYYSCNKQDEQEEVSEVVSDAKIVDVNIHPPHLTSLFAGDQGEVCIYNKEVYLGVHNIKKVGSNHVKKMVYHIPLIEKKIRKSLCDWSWYEFLTQFSCKASSAVIIGTISAGGLDYMKLSRHRMLYEYETIWCELTKKEKGYITEHLGYCNNLESALAKMLDNQQTYMVTKNKELKSISNVNRVEKITDLLTILKHPPTSLKDSPEWIVATEHVLLGTPITISRVDTCTKDQINMTCMDFKKSIKNKGKMGVEIKSFREYKIKKKGKSFGKTMGFLSVEDNSCRLDSIIVFPEALAKCRTLLYDENTVLLTGHRSDQNTFIVDKVQQLA